jgi:NAD(P)-dependent dehydrogenase (short-subunit alcohol dehydrogenase family)
MKLAEKVVVITGSGGGIGEACARRFTEEGAKVVIADINGEAVARVAGDIGTVGLAVDTTHEEEVRALAHLARRTYGEVDVWFSNAGVSGPAQPGDIQVNARWESLWALHVMAHVYAVREVVPAMLRRGDGYLLQTASVLAMMTLPEKAAYSVTKHGALALAEWLAANYRPRGIKVSCFCPGAMLTPMLLAEDLPADHPVFQTAIRPDDVADLVVQGIDAEKFLIVDSSIGIETLQAKARDYDQWLLDVGASTYRDVDQ